MLKFPTLLEFLDTKIGLIFTLHSCGEKTPEMVLQVARPLGHLDHPVPDVGHICFTYPCSIQQIKITFKIGHTLRNTAVTPAQMHSHDPKNQVLPTAASCGQGSELKPIIWHNIYHGDGR
jgi:hypothetical protein